MITRHIADLLYDHECVIVPGLGGFIKASIPARIIHTTHEFYPPSTTVAFNAGLAVNDGLLANHIALVENISFREALHEIQQWVEICHNSVKKGEKLSFEGIGELNLNASGKLEFKPISQLNFNLDSFGLPVFYAKTTENYSFETADVLPSKQNPRNNKLRRLIPETLKWAAVLAPFVAFVLWGSFKGNVIDNYVHNYTGMYSWVRSTPGKSVDVKAISAPVKNYNTPKENPKSPASILAESKIDFEPAKVSYAERNKNQISAGNNPVDISNPAINNTQSYYVIGGAFRDYNNALRLVSDLCKQGFPASIVDTTSSGLYVVSIKGCNQYDEAVMLLAEIKDTGFPGSWILKKQKV